MSLFLAHFGHAVVAGQCLLLGVDRTCRSTLVTSGFHPLRKSATGSGSGSGRLVVEIVGGVTEVSLHVRYGGHAHCGLKSDSTPCPKSAKMRNTHPEQMFSALHPKADSSQTSRHDRFVPSTDYPAKYASGVVDLLFIPCCKAEKQSLLF